MCPASLLDWNCHWLPVFLLYWASLLTSLFPAQMTVNLERHQEQLEEKQAACLEQIRELENQVTRAGEMVATSSVLLRAASQRMDSSQGSQRVLELFEWVAPHGS